MKTQASSLIATAFQKPCHSTKLPLMSFDVNVKRPFNTTASVYHFFYCLMFITAPTQTSKWQGVKLIVGDLPSSAGFRQEGVNIFKEILWIPYVSVKISMCR